jgi:hypothetical protein
MIRRLFKSDPLTATFCAGFLASVVAWLLMTAVSIQSMRVEPQGINLWGVRLWWVHGILWLFTGCVALPTFPWCLIQAMRAQQCRLIPKMVAYVALTLLAILVASAIILVIAMLIGHTS